MEHHVYLVAMLGLLVFYGLDRMALVSSDRQRTRSGRDAASPVVFRIHIASFAVYNLIIGYLLVHRETPGLMGLFFYACAMGLHYVVNDYGLREQYKAAYGHVGRWILAGGVILNVLKEELPKERKSRFWAFAVGIVAYTMLLLTL